MDWAQILVILLAVLFAFFLVIAIILAILLLRVTRQIKAVAASAERTMHTLEESVTTFNRSAIPLMVTRNIVSQVMKRTRKKDKKSDDT